MLDLNGKKFMNIQEAVQWLLDNNALPFQCSANYIANTEIGLGTIDNPSPAKVKIGSLILFADSKIATVSGLTENGFMVGTQNVNIQTALAYISNIGISASGYLITDLSDGTSINAGLIKQVSNFTIDGSQHLIAHYNDGTTTDLGAIFNGNVNIAGNLTADSIIENMIGYYYTAPSTANVTYDIKYAGVVKTGNKITFAVAGSIIRTGAAGVIGLGSFDFPEAIGQKLLPMKSNWLSMKNLYLADDYASGVNKPYLCLKNSDQSISFNAYSTSDLVENTEYFFRIEETFLLSDSLAS